MIYNLQLLRGLCALGVVIYHTHFQVVSGISTDFYGVAIFFAISGFIITDVTRKDSTGFLLKRFIRVVPLYWLITIVFFLLASFGVFNVLYTIPTWISLAGAGFVHLRNFLASQADATFTADAARHLAESFLFLPTGRPPVLGVGWTLNYEVFFYLLFAGCLAISRRWAPLVAVGVLVGLKIGAKYGLCEGACSVYAEGSTWFFVVGIAVYYAWCGIKSFVVPGRATAWFLAISVSAAWILISITWLKPPAFIMLGIVALVPLSALMCESAGLICRNRFFLTLGDASYSLYLTHLIVIETMRVVGTQVAWLDQAKSVPVMLASVLLSIALAFAVHFAVEKPLLRGLRAVAQIGGRPVSRPTAV